MNPERIYQQHREDALARQIAAERYSTFVAMPFRDTFSYRSTEVHKEIIQKAAETANVRGIAKRKFASPRRVDEAAGQAIVITEEIVVGILESHFFLADITFQNAGVILETGIALGLKPNQQIILISQGTPAEIHFDLRNNNIIFYKDTTAVEKLADAMIAAAKAFESDVDRYVDSITKSLSPPAIFCLRWYAEATYKVPAQSLHDGIANSVFPNRQRGEPELLFHLATSELIKSKILSTGYHPRAAGTNDVYGMNTTELGRAVTHKLWPEYSKPLTA